MGAGDVRAVPAHALRAPGAGSGARLLPVPDPRPAFRQRLGIRQPQRRRAAGGAQHPLHPLAAAAQQRPTAWSRARTRPWCARTSATATSTSASPGPSTASPSASSRRTSISIARAGSPRRRIDHRGRRRTLYSPNRLLTPYEKLKSLPNAAAHLKPGVTIELLDRLERELTDNQSATRMRAERDRLFRAINAARAAA